MTPGQELKRLRAQLAGKSSIDEIAEFFKGSADNPKFLHSTGIELKDLGLLTQARVLFDQGLLLQSGLHSQFHFDLFDLGYYHLAEKGIPLRTAGFPELKFSHNSSGLYLPDFDYTGMDNHTRISAVIEEDAALLDIHHKLGKLEHNADKCPYLRYIRTDTAI